MSLASQSQIDLEAGEIDRIIRDDEADREYIVEIVGDNDIRINHNERYAPDGTTLSAGQKHKIRRLRGKELYASAFDGPTAIRVREAAADVESQPEKEVTVVNADNLELAAAVGISATDGTQVDPATEQTLATELSREISTWTAGTLPVAPDGPTLPVTLDNSADTIRNNAGGIQSFTNSISASQALPSISIPDGFSLVLQADQNNDASILVDGNFPLPPGGSLSLEVTNADVVTVESASGTQDIYGIVEI